MDKITHYTVRRPGCTAWSEHDTERAARRECARAAKVTGLRHAVYAEHQSGNVTGPYSTALGRDGDA